MNASRCVHNKKNRTLHYVWLFQFVFSAISTIIIKLLLFSLLLQPSLCRSLCFFFYLLKLKNEVNYGKGWFNALSLPLSLPVCVIPCVCGSKNFTASSENGHYEKLTLICQMKEKRINPSTLSDHAQTDPILYLNGFGWLMLLHFFDQSFVNP